MKEEVAQVSYEYLIEQLQYQNKESKKYIVLILNVLLKNYYGQRQPVLLKLILLYLKVRLR